MRAASAARRAGSGARGAAAVVVGVVRACSRRQHVRAQLRGSSAVSAGRGRYNVW